MNQEPIDAALDVLFQQIEAAEQVAAMSGCYKQKTLYFRGYVHGLEYAASVLKEVMKHGNA